MASGATAAAAADDADAAAGGVRASSGCRALPRVERVDDLWAGRGSVGCAAPGRAVAG